MKGTRESSKSNILLELNKNGGGGEGIIFLLYKRASTNMMFYIQSAFLIRF